MKNPKIVEFVKFVKTTVSELLSKELRQGRVYYKEEAYSCSSLDYPAVILSLKSSSFDFGTSGYCGFKVCPVLEVLIITDHRKPFLGLSVATHIALSLDQTPTTTLLSFSIDDSNVIEADSSSQMVTNLTLNFRKEIEENSKYE